MYTCVSAAGLALWKLDLGELVAPNTRDLDPLVICTTIGCTVNVNHAKCTAQ